MHLTKTAVAALPLPAPGEPERYVYDDVVPQLAVRLRPGGRSYVFVKWDGERSRAVKSTIGKCNAMTPEIARDKAQVLIGRAAKGEDLRRPIGGLSLQELIDKWYAEKSKSNRTADEMKTKAIDYLGKLVHRPADEVSREQIGAIHHYIATQAKRRVWKRIDGELRQVEVGDPGVPATADKWKAIMSSIYGWGCGKGLVSDNPCKGVGRAFNAKEAARDTYLHGDTLLRFWKALEADADADVRDVLLLALYSGQRKGNVLRMRWEHIDLAHGLWTIPSSQTKQKRAQTNPLSAQAREVLARRYENAGSEWVFPAVRAGTDGKVGHMSESRPRDAWERITKAARIEGVRIHDLRHTAGSWLARLGSNTAVRQKALGHQTSAMAEKYSHLELDPVADAMQRMGDAIHAAATKKVAKVRPIAGRRGRS
jgi:integrase